MARQLSTAGAFSMLAVLAACANPPQLTDMAKAEAVEPLVCRGPEQCAVYWKRAQIWVAENSAWKIQIATDAVIETYNAQPYSPQRAYRITRVPMEAGQERIVITSGCQNSFGCSTDMYADALKFKRYVRQ